MNSVDLLDIPIVDAHCHSYMGTPTVLSGDDFARYASIAVQPDFLTREPASSWSHASVARARLSEMYREQPFMKYLVRLLSQFLGCKSDLESISRKRNVRAQDFDTYVKDLFVDAKIRALVVDEGYPLPLTEEHVKRIPAKVGKIFRIENLINDMLVQHTSFEEMYTAYESRIQQAVKNDGCLALKSVIAYWSGLRVRRVDVTDAKRDFDDAKNGRAAMRWFGPKVKNLRDFLFVRAMELSIDLGVPMQVHTGIGDCDILLEECDSALLYELLKDETLRHATVVLVHSGFPVNQNAAFIASTLPNVFLDFSLTIPFFNPVGYERLMEILQLAPSSKIMYGSDGFNLPELIWLGARVAKRALGKSLGMLVQEGLFDEDEVDRIGRRILFENANQLYGLALT
jgi:predicted TIM-barrel fold metal-dependent hydrolase